MKNHKKLLNEIRAMFEIQVKLEQHTLKEGTVIEAESLEAGEQVFIVTEDGNVALPVGEYEMEDGKVLVVTEEGIIAEIKEAQAAVEAEEEEEEKVDMSAYVTKEHLESVMNDIKALFSEIKSKEVKASSVKPIKPNPERKTELSKEPQPQTKTLTPLERVFAKIS
jgi:aspartokinase